jgi:AmiR/NasT family two-component response regulator
MASFFRSELGGPLDVGHARFLRPQKQGAQAGGGLQPRQCRRSGIRQGPGRQRDHRDPLRPDAQQFRHSAGGKTRNGDPMVRIAEAGRQIGQDGLCPIVILASYSDPGLLREACALPVHAYLVKPVEERELGPAIELAVERFQQLKHLQNQAVLLRDILSTRSALKRAAEYVALCEHCPTQEAQQRIQNEARAKRASLLEVADAVLRQSTVGYRYSVPI